MRRATCEERLVGTGRARNQLRESHGPGRSLVADAAFHKDPIGARGITDAFSDAERRAAAVDAALPGRESMDAAPLGLPG
jgi:hypothetical protein